MNRRNIFISVIIAMLLIVSLNVFIDYPKVLAGRWRYNSTIENIYNVTISSDDAVAVINKEFDSTGETITLKANIYQSIIGLRFDNISVPFNSTHQYFIASAYISLWSDYVPLSYESESSGITLYCERDNDDVQTFSNYTDLVSRSPSANYRNWDLDNVHGDRDAGRWNDGPNMNTMITDALDFDNDTVAIIIHSARGIWYRDFRTYDHHVDYAPRLHLILELYLWEESPPSGYEDYWFEETYRGFDIWFYEGIDDENRTGQGADVNWNILNMTKLTEQDSGSDITLHNDTWATVSSISKSVTASVYNDTGVADIATYFLRFKVNMTNVNNAIAGNDPIPSFYGLSTDSPATSAGLAYGVSGEWVGLVCIVLVDDESWRVWIHERDGVADDLQAFSVVFNENNNKMIYWEVFTNMTGPNPYTRWAWYNDPEYSDLNETKTHIHGIASGPFRYPQTLASMGQAGASTDSFEYYTFLENQLDVDQGYLITNYNGTIVTTLNSDINIGGVRVWIDNYLGASPEYDKLPWLGDLTILLVGLVGVAFIPLGFLIFLSSARDGDIIGGLTTLVIMFFIGIGCIVTWLWA